MIHERLGPSKLNAMTLERKHRDAKDIGRELPVKEFFDAALLRRLVCHQVAGMKALEPGELSGEPSLVGRQTDVTQFLARELEAHVLVQGNILASKDGLYIP